MKFIRLKKDRWINLLKIEDIIIEKLKLIIMKLFVVKFYFNFNDYAYTEFKTFEEAEQFVENLLV